MTMEQEINNYTKDNVIFFVTIRDLVAIPNT